MCPNPIKIKVQLLHWVNTTTGEKVLSLVFPDFGRRERSIRAFVFSMKALCH